MNIFYSIFKVVPNITNENYCIIEGALAHAWILAYNIEDAFRKTHFYILKDNWKVQDVLSPPIMVTLDDFTGKDIGIQSYIKAQQEGIAIVYVGWSRDGKTEMGTIELKSQNELNISKFISEQKGHKLKGRCLHYEAGSRCNKFINAHSIQKKGLLAKIAKDGHVYCLSYDYGDIKKSLGRATYKKTGIQNASTFYGFCKKHDNELFQPIDNNPLLPNDQQVFLYAYRSLCKELFVKENALNIAKSQYQIYYKQKALQNLWLNIEKGTIIGLNNLNYHKSKYDESLKNKEYQDIKYVLFSSKHEPTIVFSGLLLPDFDFMGNKIQDLSDNDTNLKLITFCSAPMKLGWGFLMSWHKSSSVVCNAYMRSLATAIHEKTTPEDFLFRLVLNCENHAISPYWWEQISDESKNIIINRISETADVFTNIPNSYLIEGLEGISNWKFEEVITNTDLFI